MYWSIYSKPCIHSIKCHQSCGIKLHMPTATCSFGKQNLSCNGSGNRQGSPVTLYKYLLK